MNMSVLNKIIESNGSEANVKMLRLLDMCEEYLENQQQLNEHMKAGFFQLTLARKQIPRLNSEDCRMDLDPAIRISQLTSFSLPDVVLSSSSSASAEPVENVVSETKIDKEGIHDSLLAFSGLPPKALQTAQKQFLEAVLLAVQNCNRVNQLLLLLDNAFDDNIL